ISFVVGGLLLFSQFGGGSPTLPPVSVSRWLLGSVAGALGLTLLYLMRVVYLSRQSAAEPEVFTDIVGETGTVTSELAPEGVVRIGNETWTAISGDDTVVAIGEPVVVTAVDDLILTVTRVEGTEC
ncbi:MAG: NfeD family protein, partial [Dehalococcoidia bacterium]